MTPRIPVAALLLYGLLSGAPALAREWIFDVSVDGLPIGIPSFCGD